MTPNPRPPVQHSSRSRGIGLASLWLPLLFLLMAIIVGVGALRLTSRGRVQPGVTVAGVEVGGLTPDEAQAALVAAGIDPDAPVTLVADGAEWTLAPADAGLAYDMRATVAEAYAVGRRGALPLSLRAMVQARLRGSDVRPIVVADAEVVRRAVEGVADTFDVPAEDASLAIEGLTVSQTVPRPGRAINVDGAVDALLARAAAGQWPIRDLALPSSTIEPAVTDASAAMDAADALLAADVILEIDDHEWRLDPPTLGSMLTTKRVDRTVALDIDRERFAQWLAPAADVVSRTAKLPRFHFDDSGGELVLVQPGETERRLDLDGTVESVLEAGRSGMRHTPLAVTEQPLAVPDDAKAADLGIVRLIDEETSHYSGSSAGRIHNIGIATAKFDGLLVEPGAEFSFNANVGDITEEEGYEETLVIMDGATTDGIGGGVCQVSTTLFRTVFWSGLPIVERYPHGYRVGYYEQQSIVGLDATVYSPEVDFIFTNDTDGWLLIETETDPLAATATFRIYGPDTGREVDLIGPVVTDEVPPPEPTTEIDPELAPGETRVVELARSGAMVTVTRVVTRDGETTRDIFYSRYRPTGAITAVAPPVPGYGGAGAAGEFPWHGGPSGETGDVGALPGGVEDAGAGSGAIPGAVPGAIPGGSTP
jgi:vancomycin resistance protein YoaR